MGNCAGLRQRTSLLPTTLNANELIMMRQLQRYRKLFDGSQSYKMLGFE